MKKAILATVLIICITFTAIAQPGHKKHQKPKFTSEQETTLAVKKLTLSLDLSLSQQEKMYPLLLEAISKKKEMMEAHKENIEKMSSLSSDEIYEKMIEKIDYQIAFQGKVKKVLKSAQYEKWHEIKSKMHKKGAQKQGKSKRKKAHS
tara:strand:- start:18691 stop:19134 length:444 start_codon:yes stop_codon:yes gene_type:complete